MLRTNIYFPKELHRKLQQIAKQEDTNVSAVVRQILEEGVKKKQKKVSGPATLLAMARNAKPTGIHDLAANHDKYLYGEERI